MHIKSITSCPFRP